MKKIKNYPLVFAALFSLGLHGLMAAFLIPSFQRASSPQAIPVEVVWAKFSSSAHPHPSPCHPRGGGDPGEALEKKTSLGLKQQSKMAQIDSVSPLRPRLRGDDKKRVGSDEKRFAKIPPHRPCEVAKRPGQSRKPAKNWVSSAPLEPRNDEKFQAQSSHNALPTYPWVCRKRGQEGVVCLEVLTNADGYVRTVAVCKSSGHTLLDKVALEAVKSWTFKEKNHQKTLLIVFRLKGEGVSFS